MSKSGQLSVLITSILTFSVIQSVDANPEEQKGKVPSSFISPPSLLNQPIAQQTSIVEVTGIKLNTTEEGMELILETSENRTLRTFEANYDQTLVINIINSQLRLSETQVFRQENPFPGITLVEISQHYANTIRIVIQGTEEVPTVDIISGTQETVVKFISPQGMVQEGSTEEESSTLTETISQQDSVNEEREEAIEIIVTATRTEQQQQEIPRSVTVITRSEIEQQTNISRNLNDILGRLVPGFGPPNGFGSSSDFQSLRGRAPVVLIDGVPLSDSSGLGRQLRTIDPASIERIEVVRGSSSLYGGGSTGGIINIITRTPSEKQFSATTKVGTSIAATGSEDKFGPFFEQNLSGTEGMFTYDLTFAAEFGSGIFDANGDRIFVLAGDGSLSDAETLNVVSKFGLNFSEEEKLQFLFNYFKDHREAFILDPEVRTTPGIQAARALKLENLEIDGGLPKRQNIISNISYTNKNFLGSELKAQAFYWSYDENGSIPADQRDNSLFGEVIRTNWNWQKFGGRLQIDTSLNSSLNLLWGTDYENEQSQQPFDIFDPTIFDQSNGKVFRKIDEGTFVPPFKTTNLGLFAQLNWNPQDNWLILAGARQEWINFSVDNYTTSDGKDIEGGDLDFNDITFNLGTVFQTTDQISLFANFAQSFSIPSFARVLRVPPTGFVNITDAFDVTQPQKVDEYEIGIRGNWDMVQFSLSTFYSTSNLGTFFVEGAGGVFVPARAPERIYGIEATLDLQPSKTWLMGGTLSWSEGENDDNNDGNFLALSSATIQPIKLTGYIQNQTTPNWTNRLQFLFVGGRNRAFEEGVDLTKIDSYIVFDFISSLKLGSGTLQLGIQNLFNTQYFPVASQFLTGFDEQFNVAGTGRTLSLSYSFSW
ncbi:TonB-dependent receptor [Cyanobacterium aponinum UTEX 3222]|uniref:TonB-dependent receptor domain-containing protein n=1 Tax=Cyanobacterium aponinum TaxID=379064 RepID=UPI00308E3C0A|nr:TonB-dependent receptor [Cyanobacterium aponinum UTEX 3222]